MRKLMMASVTFLSFGIFAAPSANATWSCDGPEYVCGAGQSAPKASSKSSYSDEDNAKPVRAAKSRKRVAAAKPDDNDEKPARRKKARSNASDNDSGGGASYSGKASYYWEPQALASGGRFNPNAMTAAHKTLPFGTRVRVTNQHNGQSVDVVINDRGPYVGGRIIDLSKAAAHAINMQGAGVAPVTVRVLGKG